MDIEVQTHKPLTDLPTHAAIFNFKSHFMFWSLTAADCADLCDCCQAAAVVCLEWLSDCRFMSALSRMLCLSSLSLMASVDDGRTPIMNYGTLDSRFGAN